MYVIVLTVPSQPEQVMARAVNSTAIFLNWTEPSEMNGLLVKYQVKADMVFVYCDIMLVRLVMYRLHDCVISN